MTRTQWQTALTVVLCFLLMWGLWFSISSLNDHLSEWSESRESEREAQVCASQYGREVTCPK